MGLFFEARRPTPEVTRLLETAFATPAGGVADPQAEAAAMAGSKTALVPALTSALQATPADPKGAASQAAQDVTNQLLGGAAFNTWRFVIAFVIFGSLVGGGIACEATHLMSSSGTLFGFAGAIFGIVTAFLGSESAKSS